MSGPSSAPSDPSETGTLTAHPYPLDSAVSPAVAVGIDRYHLGVELGRGGMGIVCHAIDTALGREVAVKVLRDDLSGRPDAHARFVFEAQVAARLDHPGVAPTHDLGTLPDGRPFLAMKLIRGRTMSEILAEQTAPGRDLTRFVQVFEVVCQTVGYAHSKGVIHRDLKPENVMVGPFGEVQVMDWGLAKILPDPKATTESVADRTAEMTGERTNSPLDSSGIGRTLAGAVMGTPAYMSPEQARGEIDRLGPPADVFALGAMLAEVLTGVRPYGDGSTAVIVARAAAADLSGCYDRLDRCGVDPELVAIVRKCLAADAADRPSDATVVADLVAVYQAGVETRLRKSEAERAAEAAHSAERHRRRNIVAALYTAVCVIVVGGMYAAWRNERLNAKAQLAEFQDRHDRDERLARARQAVTTALNATEAAVAAGRLEEAAARLDQVDARLKDGGLDDMRASVASARADFDTVRLLDDASDTRWSMPQGVRAAVAARPAYRAAFDRAGLAVGTADPTVLGQKVKNSTISVRLVAGLDEWLEVDPSQPGLVEILKVADPDPFRTAVRAAFAIRDKETVLALARTVEPDTLTPSFAATLGMSDSLPPAEAYHLLRPVYAKHSDNFVLAVALGTVSARLKATHAAVNAVGFFRAAVALKPKNVRARLMLGLSYSLAGDTEDAIIAARSAAELRPDAARSYSVLGSILFRAKDYSAAIASYRKSLSLEPDKLREAEARSGLGEVLYELGRYAEAEDEFQTAADLDPENPVRQASLADAKEAGGDLIGAMAGFRRSAEVGPTDAYAQYRYGLALYHRRQLDDAAAVLRKAVELDPKRVAPVLLLRDIALEQGDVNKAAGYASRVLDLLPADDPQRPSAEFMAGRIADLTRLQVEGVPKDDPKDVKALLQLADWQRTNGRSEDAALGYEKAFAAAESLKGQDDPEQGFRLEAARSAVRAANETGAADPDRLRSLAVKWLTKEVNSWVARYAAANAPAQRAGVRRLAGLLIEDPDFKSLQNTGALAEPDRVAAEEVWAKARRLAAGGSGHEDAPRPKPAHMK